MNQLERVHWQRSKLGGPGRVTEWVNKHHTESNRIIDDKIKSVEGSLASKGTGDTGFVYKNNPMDNPKAVKDILENPDAVYGFSPSQKLKSIEDLQVLNM